MPGDEQISFHQACCQDLVVPQGSPEKTSNFKPVSRTTKVMNFGTEGTRNQRTWSLESWEFQVLWKVDVCNASFTKCLFFNPRLRIQVRKSWETIPETIMKKDKCSVPRYSKKLQKWEHDNQVKSIKPNAMSGPVLPGAARIASGHPRCQNKGTRLDR